MKLWIVTAVDCGDSCDGHPSCLGCFKTKEEAENYVKNDMEERCDQLAGCNIEADFSRMEILDACDQPICMWSIDSIEDTQTIPTNKDKDDSVVVNAAINRDCVNQALKCLVDNGIDEDEAGTVLQAIGYTLLNAELRDLLPNA